MLLNLLILLGLVSLKSVIIYIMQRNGFTLTELLVTLGILGVIATFTIPKLLNVQQQGNYNAMAKEVVVMLSNAYSNVKLENGISADNGKTDMIPFFNYVKIDSTSVVDHSDGNNRNCSGGGSRCIKLHNGGVLHFSEGGAYNTFAGLNTTNSLGFAFDPDGVDSDVWAVQFYLYADGGITSSENILPNTYHGTNGPIAAGADPDWFSWD